MAPTPVTSPIDSRNPNDATTPLPSESNWSQTVLPPVLGRLDPSPNFFNIKTTTYLTDPKTKEAILDADGNRIKDFANIPPCISTKVEPWRVEAYFRLHGDFTYQDLWARQPRWHPKPNNPAKNRLNNVRARKVRKPLNMISWSTTYKGRPPKTLVETVERLTSKQIDQNTTWHVTPHGIVQPGNPDHILPLGYYLENSIPHTPSKEVSAALELLRKLQAKAAAQGKRHWSKLSSKDLPNGWSARVSKNRAEAATSDESEPGEDSEEDFKVHSRGVKPRGRKVLHKGRTRKRRLELSEESSEESGGESGHEYEEELGRESGRESEHESEHDFEEEPFGNEAVNTVAINMRKIHEKSDEANVEAESDSEEVVRVTDPNRRSQKSRTSTEYSSEDGMTGNKDVEPSRTQEEDLTLGHTISIDHDQDPSAVYAGGVLGGKKRQCDGPSDKQDQSNTVDSSACSQMARTVHTAETLWAMVNEHERETLSEHTIQEILEAQDNNTLSEATLAFVFSGFVPSAPAPPSQHITSPTNPFLAEQPILDPQDTWPSDSNPSHPPSPTMESRFTYRASMSPPAIPPQLLSRSPSPIIFQEPQPAAPTANTFEMAEEQTEQTDDIATYAQPWARQKAFIEREQARLKKAFVRDLLARPAVSSMLTSTSSTRTQRLKKHGTEHTTSHGTTRGLNSAKLKR